MSYTIHTEWLSVTGAQFTTYHATRNTCLQSEDFRLAWEKMYSAFPNDKHLEWRMMGMNIFPSR